MNLRESVECVHAQGGARAATFLLEPLELRRVGAFAGQRESLMQDNTK